MNRFFYILLLVIFTEKSFSQEIFTIVEESAEFPGGSGEMTKFIQENIRYPESAIAAGIGGKCFLKFVVSESGEINNVEMLKGTSRCPECDMEAIRVVKSMPKWKPARMTGKPVSSYYNLPINFSLNERKTENKEVFTIVENAAEFPGGTMAMMNYIKTNVNYPTSARKYGIGGKVFLKFVVDEEGDIGSIEVIKGSGCVEIDEEAIRVVNEMPQWKPASLSGRNVKCYFNVPINFRIDGPQLFYNSNNISENYHIAWREILLYNPDRALDMYLRDKENVESWFNIAVLYHCLGDKSKSKKYFKKVKSNISDSKNHLYVLSTKYLKQNF